MTSRLHAIVSWMLALLGDCVSLCRSKGLGQFLPFWRRTVLRWRKNPMSFLPYKMWRESMRFTFQGRTYRYFYHPSNVTWGNERAIEIAVVKEIFDRYRGKRILEVGNVLQQYMPISHEVVDKYEHAPGVTNVDIVDFNPRTAYDLIISVSTLEHVGYDEPEQDKGKVVRAFHHLTQMLAPGGMMVVTMPIGDTPWIAGLIDRGEISFDVMCCMKRVSKHNRWEQTTWDAIKNAEYGHPYMNANGIVIGFIHGRNAVVT